MQHSDCIPDNHNASGKKNIRQYQCLFSAPFTFANLNPKEGKKKKILKKKKKKRWMVSKHPADLRQDSWQTDIEKDHVSDARD